MHTGYTCSFICLSFLFFKCWALKSKTLLSCRARMMLYMPMISRLKLHLSTWAPTQTFAWWGRTRYQILVSTFYCIGKSNFYMHKLYRIPLSEPCDWTHSEPGIWKDMKSNTNALKLSTTALGVSKKYLQYTGGYITVWWQRLYRISFLPAYVSLLQSNIWGIKTIVLTFPPFYNHRCKLFGLVYILLGY